MLTLTPTAAEVVREIVASAPVDDDGGIRISAGEPTPAGTPLQIALADRPQTADTSVEESGARVFLEPAVTDFLDDKVLDAEVSDAGTSFAIRDQSGADPRNDSPTG